MNKKLISVPLVARYSVSVGDDCSRPCRRWILPRFYVPRPLRICSESCHTICEWYGELYRQLYRELYGAFDIVG